MEGYQVAHTQSPGPNVIHRRPRDVLLALGHAAFAAHPFLVHIRCPVPLPRHRRHLLPLRERGAWALCQNIHSHAAHDRPVFAHYTTISPPIAPYSYLAVPLLELQVRIIFLIQHVNSQNELTSAPDTSPPTTALPSGSASSPLSRTSSTAPT